MSPVEGEQSQGVFFTLQIHLTPKPTIIRLLTTLKYIFWKRRHHRNPQFPPKISCVMFRAKLPKTSEYSTFDRKNNPTAYFSGDYAPRIPLLISLWKLYCLFSDQCSQIATSIQYVTMIGFLLVFQWVFLRTRTFSNKKESKPVERKTNWKKKRKKERSWRDLNLAPCRSNLVS